MTTTTTQPDTASVARSARKLELPIVFVGPPEIEALIKARRAELIAAIVELRASPGDDAVEARRKLKEKLSALALILREAASVSASVRVKLDRWLAPEPD